MSQDPFPTPEPDGGQPDGLVPPDGSVPPAGLGIGPGTQARPGSPDAGPAVAALVNITVPWSTATGQSELPGEAGGFGLLDAPSARDLAAAAARHPRTRWCLTVLNPRRHRRRPRLPARPRPPARRPPRPRTRPRPGSRPAALDRRPAGRGGPTRAAA